MTGKIGGGIFSLAIVLVLAATPAVAATPDEIAADISQEIMSPFCDGVTLHDCPSQAAIDLRERIEGWARDGWSEERIVNRLEAEYGAAQIRSVPPREGTGLMAWLLPATIAGLGIAGAALLATRWARPRRREDAPTPTPEEHARIEAELNSLRGSR